MKVKEEVQELCIEFMKTEIGSKRWKEIKHELIYKWKFTPFSLLALFESEPTIEYNDENFSLVIEKVI